MTQKTYFMASAAEFMRFFSGWPKKFFFLRKRNSSTGADSRLHMQEIAKSDQLNMLRRPQTNSVEVSADIPLVVDLEYIMKSLYRIMVKTFTLKYMEL